MKNEMSGRMGGFTLIELLVVVLIIGILAAVAVPQYQMAVKKARWVQTVAVGDALWNAAQRYVLAVGDVPTTLDELDIEIPGSLTHNNACVEKSGKYVCCLECGGANCLQKEINCAATGLNVNYRGFYAPQNNRYCMSPENDGTANQLCKAVGGVYAKNNGAGDNLYRL